MTFRLSRFGAFAAGAGLLIYSFLVVRHAYYSVWGSDPTGYVNVARSLLEGRIAQPAPPLDELELPDQYIHYLTPLGYEAGPRPRTLSPIYPVGYPLHMAGGALIFGWKYGPFLVSPLAAALSLALIYLIGVELGLTRGLAIAGAAALALNPTFCLHAIQPMSDGLATFWSLAAILTALRSRSRAAWGLGAGAAFGLAFLVRPTSILLLIPILFSIRLSPRTLLLFLLGGLPFAGVFCAYNTAAYGHPLMTGYGALGLQDLVTLGNFPIRFRHYIFWLTVTMSPLPLLGWLAVALNRNVKLRDRALLISWFGVFLLFYSCYFHYAEWWYTRFLLPGMPALILGTLLVVRDLGKLIERSVAKGWGVWLRLATAIILIGVVLGFERQSVERFYLLRVAALQSAQTDFLRQSDRLIPKQTLLIATEMSGAIKFYLGRPIVRFERVGADQLQTLQARAAEKGYQWYALLLSQEVEEAQKRFPGKWTRLGMHRQISLWQIETDRYKAP
ncbi:MAG TPA: glycosyltransferase family 39 protein [Blastocatellia bacterium]|nr:glycosyltransferase family 39 protein [Blastocatellia bacterium]